MVFLLIFHENWCWHIQRLHYQICFQKVSFFFKNGHFLLRNESICILCVIFYEKIYFCQDLLVAFVVCYSQGKGVEQATRSIFFSLSHEDRRLSILLYLSVLYLSVYFFEYFFMDWSVCVFLHVNICLPAIIHHQPTETAAWAWAPHKSQTLLELLVELKLLVELELLVEHELLVELRQMFKTWVELKLSVRLLWSSSWVWGFYGSHVEFETSVELMMGLRLQHELHRGLRLNLNITKSQSQT